jgi:hypothetical protein
MDVDPTAANERFPTTVPVPCPSDDLEVSGTAAIPGHRAAGALGCVRHDRVRGRALLAFDARAAAGTARARWRRRVQGGSAIKRADHGEGRVPCTRAHSGRRDHATKAGRAQGRGANGHLRSTDTTPH